MSSNLLHPHRLGLQGSSGGDGGGGGKLVKLAPSCALGRESLVPPSLTALLAVDCSRSEVEIFILNQ